MPRYSEYPAVETLAEDDIVLISQTATDTLKTITKANLALAVAGPGSGSGGGNFVSVVDFGAVLDGSAQTAAEINEAIDFVDERGGGTVWFPTGTYLVSGISGERIIVKDNVKLEFEAGCVINTGAHSGVSLVISINTQNQSTIENVVIEGNGLVINGNRTATSTQYGLHLNCQSVGHVLNNIIIRNVVVNDCRTDGLTIGGNAGALPTNIYIYNVVCDNAYRNGASIIGGKRITIADSIFKNTNGSSPGAGFDLEPDASLLAEDIIFTNCRFDGNETHGLYAQAGLGTTNRVEVQNCYAEDNAQNGIVCNGATNVKIVASRAWDNGDSGIYAANGGQVSIFACAAHGNGDYGILCGTNSGATVSGCLSFNNGTGFSLSTGVAVIGVTTCTGCLAWGNTLRGFNLSYAFDVMLSGCTAVLNGQEGIQLYESQNCTVTGCNAMENSQVAGDIDTDNILLEHNANNNHVHGNTVRQSRRFFKGTATAGSTTTITLPTSAYVFDDDFYNGMTARIVGGTGSGQSKAITDYNSTTRVITLASALSTAADNTSEIEITGAIRPRFGIRVGSGCLDNKVTDNDCFAGGASGGFSDGGTDTITTSGNRT
jgi:parallel beta-helix repeat protein